MSHRSSSRHAWRGEWRASFDYRKAEIGIYLHGQLDKGRGLLADLVFGTEDVGVVLGEAAHPHDAVQRTGWLVAVAGAELGHAQWQVTVGLEALIETSARDRGSSSA
jgi:hypothetical protein